MSFPHPAQEASHTDSSGQRWIHVPWVGWVKAEPSPFLRAPEPSPLVDWSKCPACGEERWHHLGDFEYKPTGRVVDVAVLEELPVATLHEPNEKQVVHLAWHIEEGTERKRLIRRECRNCGHRFREDTGVKDVTRTEQP